MFRACTVIVPVRVRLAFPVVVAMLIREAAGVTVCFVVSGGGVAVIISFPVIAMGAQFFRAVALAGAEKD